jgi:hypothetical protein
MLEEIKDQLHNIKQNGALGDVQEKIIEDIFNILYYAEEL